MATDIRALIQLPPWLRRPENVPAGEHQVTLFARGLGAVLNGVRDRIYLIRRQWIASLATGRFLEEHGADRAVYKREGEAEEDYRARVLWGLRAKTPGETKAGMRIALNTLGLTGYELVELYTLPVEDPSDPRWDTFEVRYPDTGNEGLTDAQVQARIDAAKPPRADGIAVRYQGALVDGFGATFDSDFGS